MVLNLNDEIGTENIFKTSPEDDQVLTIQGTREIPDDQTQPTPVQARVDISQTDTSETERTSQSFGVMREIRITPTTANNCILWAKLTLDAKSSDGNNVTIKLSFSSTDGNESTTNSTTYDSLTSTIDFDREFVLDVNSSYLLKVEGRHTVASEKITITNLILTIFYMDNTTTTTAGDKWSAWIN